jgi:hypothetical protein
MAAMLARVAYQQQRLASMGQLKAPDKVASGGFPAPKVSVSPPEVCGFGVGFGPGFTASGKRIVNPVVVPPSQEGPQEVVQQQNPQVPPVAKAAAVVDLAPQEPVVVAPPPSQGGSFGEVLEDPMPPQVPVVAEKKVNPKSAAKYTKKKAMKLAKKSPQVPPAAAAAVVGMAPQEPVAESPPPNQGGAIGDELEDPVPSEEHPVAKKKANRRREYVSQDQLWRLMSGAPRPPTHWKEPSATEEMILQGVLFEKSRRAAQEAEEIEMAEEEHENAMLDVATIMCDTHQCLLGDPRVQKALQNMHFKWLYGYSYDEMIEFDQSQWILAAKLCYTLCCDLDDPRVQSELAKADSEWHKKHEWGEKSGQGSSSQSNGSGDKHDDILSDDHDAFDFIDSEDFDWQDELEPDL